MGSDFDRFTKPDSIEAWGSTKRALYRNDRIGDSLDLQVIFGIYTFKNYVLRVTCRYARTLRNRIAYKSSVESSLNEQVMWNYIDLAKGLLNHVIA